MTWKIKRAINNLLVDLLYFERRVDPYFRDLFDRLFQRRLSALVQTLINLQRRDEHLSIAEERLLPNEVEATNEIVRLMSAFIRKHYAPGEAQRAGNTKTYGLVRGEFEVLPDLADHLRQGIFTTARTYPAWVRFAGPGPLSPPDLKDAGILSIGVKLMGVGGSKLIDDEKMTQDFLGISAPTFTTPNVIENVKLQRAIGEETPVFYFINPLDPHYLDMVMQSLYARTQTSPLEVRYWSCAPYLFGEGRAIQYSLVPTSGEHTRVPRHPSGNYLREAMAHTLRSKEGTFDFKIQFQTDPHKMPIENASVEWPERLSPFITVATLRVPPQKFDSPAQLNFAGNLSFDPWHSVAEHRPLGNQNRARKVIYLALSKYRQSINGQARIEPTGGELFEP